MESELTKSISDNKETNEYFESYEDPEVHRLMIKDKARTETYRDAIFQNKHLFEGKTVMDVGAGTGILSLFMAKAGAKKVYAVEASRMAELLKDIVRDNGYSDIIEVLHCPIEKVSLKNNEKVDVIISEWMGFYLLHESMLDSILFARDKFLSVDGKLFPSEARIYASPCSLVNLYEEQIDFWDDVYGFNMGAVKSCVKKSKMLKPEVCTIPAGDLLAEPVCIKSLSLDSIVQEDITEFSETSFIGITRAGLYQGLCMWFECDFDGRTYDEDGNELGKVITLSTSPLSEPTHWKQTVIMFSGAMEHMQDDEEPSPEKMESEISDPSLENSKNEKVSNSSSINESNQNQLEIVNKDNHYEVEEDNVVGWRVHLSQCSKNKRHYNVTFEMLDPEIEEHPIPCNCPMPRCLIIAKMIEKEDEMDE